MSLSQETYNSHNPKIMYVVNMTLNGIGGERLTLRLSDLPLNTDDTFPVEEDRNQRFEPRLEEPLTYSRNTVSSRYGGRSNFQGGEIRFSLEDNKLVFPLSCDPIDSDTEIELTTKISACGILNEGTTSAGRFLSLYDTGGQNCKVYIYDYENNVVEKLYDGTMRSWFVDVEGQVVVPIGGVADILDIPIQRAKYAGTGDLEGTIELEGQSKPVALGGLNVNCTPVLINKADRLYEVHTDKDGNGAPVNDIVNVYIGGVEIVRGLDYPDTAALRAASVPAGEGATCFAEGRFRLGSDPGSDVTCNVIGAEFGGTHYTQVGELVREVVDNYSDFGLSYFDTSNLSDFDSERGYEVARYIGLGEEITFSQFFDEICASVEGTWGDDSQGVIKFFNLSRPSDVAVSGDSREFNENDIIVDTFEFIEKPSDVDPAIKDYIVRYAIDNTINSVVTAPFSSLQRLENRQEYLTRAFTGANSPNYFGLVEGRFPTAKKLEVTTLIENGPNAEIFRNALLDLYDGTLKRVRFATSIKGYQVEIGDIIQVDNDEEDFSELVFVTGKEVTTSEHETVIEGLYEDD